MRPALALESWRLRAYHNGDRSARPGITVPDWLRARMAEAPDDASALEIGIEEAQSLASKIKQIADGLYLMPPFGNHHIAERVMEAVI